MRGSLLWRLLGAQLVVIAIAIVVSGVAISQLATHSFMAIMKRFHIEPAAIETQFHAESRRILIVSSLLAASVSMLLAWILVTRIVRPLKQMMTLAERIAEGDYARRLDAQGSDEIGRLAESLNRMASSLQRVEGLRRDLVANVAHELRTPLTTLRGYLEALRDGVTPASPETLASLHEEVLRLVRLVDDLQQLSQFDASLSRLHPASVDLSMLADRTMAVYRPGFAERGLALGPAPGLAPPPIYADADLVGQALRNLLENALRYAQAGASVTVATRLAGGEARIEVSNTGEGIAPHDLPHIFERFYRGEKSRSRETGGTGIGLAIVQEIARAHGGRTGVTSAHGLTTVWFSLPVEDRTRGAPKAGNS